MVKIPTKSYFKKHYFFFVEVKDIQFLFKHYFPTTVRTNILSHRHLDPRRYTDGRTLLLQDRSKQGDKNIKSFSISIVRIISCIVHMDTIKKNQTSTSTFAENFQLRQIKQKDEEKHTDVCAGELPLDPG